jgi:hypothetical protein
LGLYDNPQEPGCDDNAGCENPHYPFGSHGFAFFCVEQLASGFVPKTPGKRIKRNGNGTFSNVF